MKKIAILICMILVVTLVCSSCSNKYTWENALTDIEKIKDAGFEVYDEDTPEAIELDNEMLNRQLKMDKQDFVVELSHVCALKLDDYTIVGFYEFANENQSKQMYDYYMQLETEQKYVRFGKIIINTNSAEAESVLGYKFQ